MSSKVEILGPDARPVRRAQAVAVTTAPPPTAYASADPMSQELAAFHPALLSGDAAWLRDRNPTVARLRDLVRNSPSARSAVKKFVDHVVGPGFRLKALPNWRALGITFGQAEAFAEQVEAEWQAYTGDPLRRTDLRRRLSEGERDRLAMADALIAGECVTLAMWREREGWPWRTCFRSVDPDLLANPMGQPDSQRLRGGVELDGDGASVAYHFRRAHPSDWMLDAPRLEWERVERETGWGRPVVIHWFTPERADETRGVSPLAVLVKRLRMLDRYQDSELAGAILSAVLLAAIESPFDHEMAAQALQGGGLGPYQDLRKTFHQERGIAFGGVRIPMFFPGEKLTFHNATRPFSGFPEFEASVHRGVASATGQAFESIAADYSRTNYSSARAALLDAWKSLSAVRTMFTAGHCTPRYVAWLEEAIDRGAVRLPAGAPGFHEALGAWAACRWAGPGRGWVDPTKEAQGAQMRMDSYLSTLDRESEEQGGDWRENLEQAARERRAMAELGLPEPTAAGISQAAIAGGDDADARDQREREETQP